MKETIKSIIEWSEQTFPDANLEGQIDKFSTEYEEYFEANTLEEQAEELADVFVVAFGISRFDLQEGLFYINEAWQLYYNSPFAWEDLEQAINKKMKINRGRKWNKVGNNFQHVEE